MSEAPELCPQGCYWPGCGHRPGDPAVDAVALAAAAFPAAPRGTHWEPRGGVQVPVREPRDEAAAPPPAWRVDDHVGELIAMAGRPWSSGR